VADISKGSCVHGNQKTRHNLEKTQRERAFECRANMIRIPPQWDGSARLALCTQHHAGVTEGKEAKPSGKRKLSRAGGFCLQPNVSSEWIGSCF
jgi:hypothetical protein